MRILIDMNLSPAWVDVFVAAGWEAVHWSAVGSPSAEDAEIMEWATRAGFAVFTHDLDFGALLAATKAEAPSVVQLRSKEVTPARMERLVVAAIRQFEYDLKAGALIVVDPQKTRARVLPLA